MRLAGKLDDQHDAATFIDYLLTQGISAKVERQGDGWELWIFDEDQLPKGREELASFKAEPEAERYRIAGREAERLRREKADKERAARRNIIRTSPARPRSGRPVTTVLLVAISVMFVMSGFGENRQFQRPFFLDRTKIVDGHEVWVPLAENLREQPWRLFTPMLLHRDLIHFIFNAVTLMSFGSVVEMLRGSWRYALLIVFIAAISHLTQYWWDHRHGEPSLFIGISGVVFGLIGYVWMKAWNEPMSGFYISDQTIIFVFVFHLLCMSGYLGAIANGAHIGGQIAGMVAGAAPTLLRGLVVKR